MAQQFRVCSGLAEDLGSVPDMLGSSQPHITPASGNPIPSFSLYRSLHTPSQTYTEQAIIGFFAKRVFEVTFGELKFHV